MADGQSSFRRVIIVGGGFSGTALARALIEASAVPLVLTIVEPREKLGAGIAYDSAEPGHLLNGPAAVFSLYPDRPGHFQDWLAAYAGADRLDQWRDGADVFAPRALYARYVGEEMRKALGRARGRVVIEHVRSPATAIGFERDAAFVTVEDGRRFAADHVVLATGVPSVRPDFESPALAAHPNYLADPWDLARYGRFAAAGRLALIGSGLTMLDALVSLDRAGFKGQVEIVSRRGLSVWARRPAQAWPGVLEPSRLPTTAREVLRLVQVARRGIRAAEADWQGLPLALTPSSGAIWDGADDRERRRYLRHLRPYWEITRHRAAPPTARLADAWRRDGRLRQNAGRVESVTAEAGGLRIALRRRGTADLASFPVDGVVNCTGAEFDVRKAAKTRPLFARLLEDGIIRPGPVSFGIDAERDGTVRGADGTPNLRLSALGPLLRGVHWESNALPEILPQVAALAERLAHEGAWAIAPG